MVPALLALGVLVAAPEPASLPPSVFVPPADRLPRGATSWRETEVELAAAPEGPLRARILGASASGPARIWPFAEVREVKGRRARVRYPVGVAPRGAGVGVVRAVVVVLPLDSARALGRARIEHVVRVAPELSPVEVDALASAHASWMEVAGRAAVEGASVLSLERLPSAEDLEPAAVERREAFGRARVEAAAIRARLQAVLLGGSEEAAAAALFGLARLSGPRAAAGDEGERRPLESTIGSALASAGLAIRGGRLLEARERLRAVRSSGAARPEELARVLLLESVLAAAGGRAQEARVLAGQARCLRPGVSVELGLAVLERVAAPALREDPCEGRAIGVGEVEAKRVGVEGSEAGLRVVVPVVNDPAHLVATVRIERLGSGGGPSGSQAVPVEPGRPATATFLGTKEALHRPRQVGLRIELRDRFGTPVTSSGVDAPLLVELSDGPGAGGFEVPPWVWAVLGGAAVVAAGAAVGVAASGDDNERVVGPVSVSF